MRLLFTFMLSVAIAKINFAQHPTYLDKGDYVLRKNKITSCDLVTQTFENGKLTQDDTIIDILLYDSLGRIVREKRNTGIHLMDYYTYDGYKLKTILSLYPPNDWFDQPQKFKDVDYTDTFSISSYTWLNDTVINCIHKREFVPYENLVCHFEYNSKGQLIEKKWFDKNEQVHSFEVFTYTPNGNPKKHFYHGVVSFVNEYNYMPDSKTLLSIKKQFSGGGRNTFMYDNNRIEEVLRFDKNNQQTGKVIYTYNSQGLLIKTEESYLSKRESRPPITNVQVYVYH